MSLPALVKGCSKFIFLVLMAASGVAQAEKVYIQSLSQGPDVGSPAFIFLGIKPALAVCPQAKKGRLKWNGDLYPALRESMDKGRPVWLHLGQPNCDNMFGTDYVNIRNFDLLPQQAAPIKPSKSSGPPAKFPTKFKAG